jgi:hypothetical protein
MNPLLALLALDPVLPICVSILSSLKIDLTAEVTVLVVRVGSGARLAQHEELAVLKLSTGPLLAVAAE